MTASSKSAFAAGSLVSVLPGSNGKTMASTMRVQESVEDDPQRNAVVQYYSILLPLWPPLGTPALFPRLSPQRVKSSRQS